VNHMGESEIRRSSFGKWLREQRRTLDLTQEAFADQIGCARITLRRLENDALKPSKELALLLLEKVGIPQHEREAWLPFARGLGEQPLKQTISFPAPIRNNLPASLTTFIGRGKEQVDVIQLLKKHRLVTLTGSGGVGKTRLSIQAAADLLTEFPIGIWLVELAPLTDPALVPQSVCAVMGVKPDGDTSALEALTNYLRNKKLLLVLDNCEHLIEACAQLCNSLLRSCPDLHILASSREALNLNGEQAYRVPSLSLPDSKDMLQIILESEAVKLFVERATASHSEFEINEDNAPIIALICKRLDGIALAIELAASRVKMFKVEQIAMRLDDVFRLLTGNSRTALPRQQTLRALIDWSYNLLSIKEQTLLRKLSVFIGGWTLDSAEAVCGNNGMLDLLTRLVDKSLVSVDQEHGDESRYYLLETVRQYAHEKLVESNEDDQLRQVHLDHFLKTAERIAPELHTRSMLYWLEYLKTDYPNFQVALESAQECEDETGLLLCNALFRLWENRSEYRKEGIEWIGKFLNRNPARSRTRVLALLNFYNLSTNSPGSTSEKVIAHLNESLALARDLGDHACLAMVLGSQGSYELFNGNYDAAQGFYDQSLIESRQSGDQRLIGIALYRLGQLFWYRTEYAAAQAHFEEGLVFLRKVGDLGWWALDLNFLGLMSTEQGDWKTARRYFEEALSLSKEAHDRSYTSVYLLNLGFLSLGIGDFEQGISFLIQARDLVQNTPDDHFFYDILKGLGEIARFQEKFDQAAAFYKEALTYPQWETDKANTYCLLAHVECLGGQRAEAKKHLLAGLQFLKTKADWIYSADDVIPYIIYFAVDRQMAGQASSFFGWVEYWNKKNGHVQPPVYRQEFDRYLARAREQLSESEFNTAWVEGQSMSQEQVLALAMEVLQ
jgi:predicted ATPase/DNA-binding XRE family transcriptional regulator